MAKIDPTVIRETRLAAAATLLFSLAMHAVFALLGQWSPMVLWGNLLGGATAVLDYFLLGLTVQKAVSQEEKQARNTIRASQQMRLLFKAGILCLAFAVKCFHPIACILSLFFPRLHILLRPLWDKDLKKSGKGGAEDSIDAIEKGRDEA